MHFLRDLKEPYAWPGGYPRYFITSDGEAMSYDYAEENEDIICEAIDERDAGGWRVVACDINFEDAALYCCGNGKRIASAYAEDEAEELT
jgi:hypothetical protein